MEEGENPAKESLRKAVKLELNKNLNTHVKSKEWEKSFDLAERLVILLSTGQTTNPKDGLELNVLRPNR